MKATFSITGDRELMDAFKELSKATGRNVLRRALMKAAEPIEQTATANAPKRTGALRKSVTTSAKAKNAVGNAEYAAVMKAGGTKAEASKALRAARSAASTGNVTAVVYIGPGNNPQGLFQEFGTLHHKAQPWLGPAFNANKDQAEEIFKREVMTEITKAAERAARKAQRAAAKAAAS